MRNIISDDESLQEGVLPALREYNLAQFITADVPGHNHHVSRLRSTYRDSVLSSDPPLQSIISAAARVVKADQEEGENIDRFWDPRSRTSFRFDHLSLVRTRRLYSRDVV